jgi:hypothetical protein
MVERIFSASASGRRGASALLVDLIEANISPEEIGRRRTPPTPRLQVAARLGSRRRRSALAFPSGACHPRATQGGPVRYTADNHGQLHSTNELVIPRSASLNPSREYA